MVSLSQIPHFKNSRNRVAMHTQNLPASALTWNLSDLNILRTNKPATTMKKGILSYFG
jgi:hypothetical protein